MDRHDSDTLTWIRNQSQEPNFLLDLLFAQTSCDFLVGSGSIKSSESGSVLLQYNSDRHKDSEHLHFHEPDPNLYPARGIY